MNFFDYDRDFEDGFRKFLAFLQEMEDEGYIEKDGNKVDQYGNPIYKITKKGKNKAINIELKYTGRNN